MVCLLYAYNIVINLVDIKGYIITLAVIAVFSVISDIILFGILKYLYNKDNLEKDSLLMQKELKLERNYYNKIVSNIEKTNKINIKSDKKKSKSLVKDHGVGLTILKDIASNYEGELDIKNDDNSYEITLWLKDN